MITDPDELLIELDMGLNQLIRDLYAMKNLGVINQNTLDMTKRKINRLIALERTLKEQITKDDDHERKSKRQNSP